MKPGLFATDDADARPPTVEDVSVHERLLATVALGFDNGGV